MTQTGLRLLRSRPRLRLRRPSGRRSQLVHLRRSEEPLRRLRNGRHEEISGSARREHRLSHLLHPHVCEPLHVLTGQVGLALFLPLSEGDVERLRSNDASVHFRHGLGSLVGTGEADESEAFRATVLEHDLRAGYGSERSELLSQSLVVDVVVDVLHVQVHPLVSVQALDLQLLEFTLQLLLTFRFLLSAAHEQRLKTHASVLTH